MPDHSPSNEATIDTAHLRAIPVQARARSRLERLDDAARVAIARYGRDRFTTAQIAEIAESSIGTVYRYFPDRYAVLSRIWPERRDEFMNDTPDSVDGIYHPSEPARASVRIEKVGASTWLVRSAEGELYGHIHATGGAGQRARRQYHAVTDGRDQPVEPEQAEWRAALDALLTHRST